MLPSICLQCIIHFYIAFDNRQSDLRVIYTVYVYAYKKAGTWKSTRRAAKLPSTPAYLPAVLDPATSKFLTLPVNVSAENEA